MLLNATFCRYINKSPVAVSSHPPRLSYSSLPVATVSRTNNSGGTQDINITLAFVLQEEHFMVGASYSSYNKYFKASCLLYRNALKVKMIITLDFT